MLLISCCSEDNRCSGTIPLLTNISIQYSVSLASFNAISYLLMKSFLDWAETASEQFAPIEVEERKNCLANMTAGSLNVFCLIIRE